MLSKTAKPDVRADLLLWKCPRARKARLLSNRSMAVRSTDASLRSTKPSPRKVVAAAVAADAAATAAAAVIVVEEAAAATAAAVADTVSLVGKRDPNSSRWMPKGIHLFGGPCPYPVKYYEQSASYNVPTSHTGRPERPLRACFGCPGIPG